MLYPQLNSYRNKIDISGIWKFRIDPEKIGETEQWQNGIETDLEIAVPGSWNEQLEEEGLLDYSGNGWFETDFVIPYNFTRSKIWLRVGSADFYSKVWIDGKLIGDNNGGYLPFEFDISDFVKPGKKSKLVIMVNNELTNETIPQGITFEDYDNEGRLREETYPPARFDFSPNGGIHRPVFIYTTPNQFINKVKVDTKVLKDQKGKVDLEIQTQDVKTGQINIRLQGDNETYTASVPITENKCSISIDMEKCRYWSNKDPFLYELVIQLSIDD
ncbi:MAG: hypothetical protein PVH88_25550, partial [Ignavibacteria bacterium]